MKRNPLHIFTSPPGRPTASPALTLRPSPSAFTLIELLVVIAIISILMAVAVPAIAIMARLTRGGASQTTIGIAVRTAAAYAGKPKRIIDKTDPLDPGQLVSNGAAILFTPNGDIRILETDLLAYAKGTPVKPLQSLTPTTCFGYTDVPNREYINLPGNAGAVGIVNVNGQVQLIAPPFAVRFDSFGQASTGYASGDERQMVFYDSNYDGKYDTASNRMSTYSPDVWNSKLDGTWNKQMDDAGLRPKLPFERIETVVGILIFQLDDLHAGGGTTRNLDATASGWINTVTRDWLLEAKTNEPGKFKNAQVIFFSRNSGSILKEYP